MKKHPTKVAGFDGTLEELAQNVFRLRYDKIADFLFYASQELRRQYENDEKNGKKKLAMMSLLALYKIGELSVIMRKIFVFCKPFMKNELTENDVTKETVMDAKLEITDVWKKETSPVHVIAILKAAAKSETYLDIVIADDTAYHSAFICAVNSRSKTVKVLFLNDDESIGNKDLVIDSIVSLKKTSHKDYL
jgi:hypothetical protein